MSRNNFFGFAPDYSVVLLGLTLVFGVIALPFLVVGSSSVS